jgi:hypothetical protein
MSAAVEYRPPAPASAPKCHAGTARLPAYPWTIRSRDIAGTSNVVSRNPSGPQIRSVTSVWYGEPAAWPRR